MDFLSDIGPKEDAEHLRIAWKVLVSNAASAVLKPTIAAGRFKRGRLKRNLILSFDIPKLCKLVDNEEYSMLLRTKAQLLYGASKIMRQQSFFLYEDSIQLCNRLKSGMTDPAQRLHIDMDKPVACASAITLYEQENLLEFTTSSNAPSFSNLFDYNSLRSNQRDNALQDLDESISLLLRLEASTINLPTSEIEHQERLLSPSSPLDDQQQPNNESIIMTNTEEANIQEHSFDIELFDIDNQDNMQAEIDFDDDDGGEYTQASPVAEYKGQDDTIFDFPMLRAADIPHQALDARARYPVPSPNLLAHNSSPSRSSIGPIRNINSGPPSLIQEEDEEEDADASLQSMTTDMYDFIVSDSEPIVVSQIPPTKHHPRSVRRMMMATAQDTVLPFMYTTDSIVNIHRQQRQSSEKERLKKITTMLRYPSIAFDPFQTHANLERGLGQQEKLGFFNKSRLFENLHHKLSDTEYARAIERSRRFDHRRDTSGSSSSHQTFLAAGHNNTGGAVSMRSTSDIHTPEIHNLDLGGEVDIDTRLDNNNARWQFGSNNSALLNDDVDYDMDYGYLNFDQELGSQPVQDNHHEGVNKFFEEVQTFIQTGTLRIHVDDIFQSKARSQVSLSFYYILELASKNKLRPTQGEPYGPIDIEISV